jgi:20S proteasome alpha/beta subunit
VCLLINGLRANRLRLYGMFVCFCCSKFMRTECLHHKYSYSEQLLVSKLVDSVGNKMQYQTQIYSRRPYGVGLIVAGYDVCGCGCS